MKRKFRILSLGFVVVLMLSATALAGDGVDSEPNNTMSQAELISWRTTNGEVDKVVGATGYIGYSGDVDYYKIYLVTGDYGFTLTNNNMSSTSNIFGSLPGDYDIQILNSSGGVVAGSYAGGGSDEQGYFTVSTSGYYYVKIYGYAGAYSSSVPYKMMLSHGDTAILMEGQRYRFFPHSSYGRLNSGAEYHSYGMAYSYGSKDSLSQYQSKMAEADSYVTYPFDNWADYSSSHPKPARFDTEYPSNNALWAGVDCSGLILYGAIDSTRTYSIESQGPNNCDTTCISDRSTTVNWSQALVGRTVKVKSSHVAMISRLASTEQKSYILHAYSGSLTTTLGRVVQETPMTEITYTTYALKTLN